MSQRLLNRYVWLVDTIRRHGRISLAELNRCWLASSLSDGHPLPRRTFYHYRDAAEEMFDINILCDRSTFEYYIEETSSSNNDLQNWLLNSMSLSGVLSEAANVSSRIVLEAVPSSREHLPVIIDALKLNHRISFTYRAYTRSTATTGNVLEPYFVKIFKQLWYVIGYHVKDGRIKTYSLDRMSDVTLLNDEFIMPINFSPQAFFKDCFGIITTEAEPKRITLRVEPRQAKYFRALPLHPSQTEEIHDNYSIFHYVMRNTYDLREEILSHSDSVEVLEPPELRTMIANSLAAALKQYKNE